MRVSACGMDSLNGKAGGTGFPEAGPSHQRAEGAVRANADFDGRFTRVERLYQSGCLRMLFPNTHRTDLAGVIVNTAGGLTGGDRLETDIRVRPRATLSVTSQAAEKVYRSAAGDAEILVRLDVGESGELAWIPHQTILFNGGRLQRRIEAHVAQDASLWLMESLVLGRLALGEEISAGKVEENWQVWRGGQLVHAEAFRMDCAELAGRSSASLAGQKCVATLLHVGPGIDAKLHEARRIMETDPQLESGASAWNGRLLIRLAGRDPAAIWHLQVRLLCGLRSVNVPRNLMM